MTAIKFFLFVCLAFTAGQAQAASTAEPKDGFFIYQILEDIVKIVQVIVDAVNANIDDVDKVVQDLLKLLPPDTVENVQKIVDWIKQALKDEDVQIAHIIEVLNKALKDLKAIDSCVDPQASLIKAIVDALISAINSGIQGAIDNHKEDVDNCIAGFAQDLAELRALYDTNLPDAVKCLSPGNNESCTCLEDVKNTVVNGIISLGANLVLHLTAANDVILQTVVPEAVESIEPAFGNFTNDVEKPNNEICNCVTTLN